jgi:hypothetical protein
VRRDGKCHLDAGRSTIFIPGRWLRCTARLQVINVWGVVYRLW